MIGTEMNVRKIALDVCGTLASLALPAAAVCYLIWLAYQAPEHPAEPFQEDIDSIAADARATADYALAYADAGDLTDTGPGAPKRMRAARLVAIDLNLAAKEAERKAQEADEAAQRRRSQSFASSTRPIGRESKRRSALSKRGSGRAPARAQSILSRERERRQAAISGSLCENPRELRIARSACFSCLPSLRT
jgi:hypothetical protein